MKGNRIRWYAKNNFDGQYEHVTTLVYENKEEAQEVFERLKKEHPDDRFYFHELTLAELFAKGGN